MYFNSGISWPCYDKITEKRSLSLPDGTVLPISLVRETYTEYEKVSATMAQEQAEDILKEELLAALSEEIGDGEIAETYFDTSVQNGVITVTLNAECLEQIGETRPLSSDEMLVLENTEEENGHQ